MLVINIKDIDCHRSNRAVDANRLRMVKISIKKEGLIHPIVVCKIQDRYFLLDGQYRMEACKALGYTTIPAIIEEGS